jgi:hypothetical protein
MGYSTGEGGKAGKTAYKAVTSMIPFLQFILYKECI